MTYDKTAAYDLSLFDTKEYEKKPSRKAEKAKAKTKAKVVRMPDEAIDKIRLRKHNPIKIALGTAGVLAATAIISLIMVGQVQLTELNQKIITAESTLADQKSVYTQTQMAVQSNLSTAGVQEYAEENLGMTKATNSQKEYIELSEGDKAEVTNKSDDNFFSAMIEAVSDLWS